MHKELCPNCGCEKETEKCPNCGVLIEFTREGLKQRIALLEKENEELKKQNEKFRERLRLVGAFAPW